MLFDEDDIYYDVGDKGLYKVAGGPVRSRGWGPVSGWSCPARAAG